MRPAYWLAMGLMLSALAPAGGGAAGPQFAPSYFDGDGDGLDDRLAPLLADGEAVDLFLVFHAEPGAAQLRALAALGLAPDYISRYLPVIAVDGVDAALVPRLVALPGLKLVEWQAIYYPLLNVAAPADKVRQNDDYSPVAWDAGLTGAGINIAILDTGVDDDHESLAGRYIAGVDFTDLTGTRDGSANPDDRNGHGTHTASTALGTGGDTDNDGDGEPDYMGIAPGARLVDVKVMTDLGAGGYLLQGIEWSIDHRDDDWEDDGPANNGIQVISMSVSSGGNSNGTDTISQAVNEAVSYGIVAVAAMGNAGDREVPSPAAADWAIAVAWMEDLNTITRNDDYRHDDSNYGPRDDDDDDDRWDELKPDVIAPGSNITAACAVAPLSPIGCTENDQYIEMSGTSMATPQVAGLVALLLEDNPSLAPGPGSNPVLWRLRNFSEPRGAASEPENSTRYNYYTGWGYIDGYQALNRNAPDGIVASLATNPAEPVEGDSVEVTVRVENQGYAAIDEGTLRVRADAALLDEFTIEDLASGASAVWRLTWEPTEGDYTLRGELLAISPAESDTGNNERELAVSVGPAPSGVDLALVEVSIDPAEPVDQERVTVRAVVRNQGDRDATSFELRFYDEQDRFARLDQGGLAAGDTLTASATWIAREGDRTLTVRLGNAVPDDGNGGNDERILAVTVAPPPEEPDFTPVELTLDGTREAGQEIELGVRVRNLGQTDGSVELELRLDDETVLGRSLDVAAGATVAASVAWTAVAGEHDLVARLTNGDPSEASVENNRLSLAFTVTALQPEFVLRDLAVTPAVPVLGETAVVSVIVANEGAGDGTATVELYAVTGDTMPVATVERWVAAGGETQVEFTWVPATWGGVLLRVVVGTTQATRMVQVVEPVAVALSVTPAAQVLSDGSTTFTVRLENLLAETQELYLTLDYEPTNYANLGLTWESDPEAITLAPGEVWQEQLQVELLLFAQVGTIDLEIAAYRGYQRLAETSVAVQLPLKPARDEFTLAPGDHEKFQLFIHNPLDVEETYLIEATPLEGVEVQLNSGNQAQVTLAGHKSGFVLVELGATGRLPTGNQTLVFTSSGVDSGQVYTTTVTLNFNPPPPDDDDRLLPGPGLVLTLLALLALARRR